MAPYFANRREAGRLLARRLEAYRGDSRAVVLALPRGGVPVAFEVATALDLPLEAFVVRKLGVPGREELAMGAIASGGVVVRNDEVLSLIDIPEPAFARTVERERVELQRREREYRSSVDRASLEGKTAIVIDDGLATGSTMRAAVAALRGLAAGRVVVAVPAAARDTCVELEDEADEVLCATTPEPFFAVGAAYEDFRQTTDREVQELLGRARRLRRDARLEA